MLTVREIETSKLVPWEQNPRINDHAVDAVAKSIETFGFNAPILCDENMTIIAGHTRWKAADKLGMRTVPVIILPMSDEQRRAYAIADNKLSELAEWDTRGLQAILGKLCVEKVELPSLGFCRAELDAILTQETQVDWAAFDEDLQRTLGKTHVLLPVKVAVDKKDAVQEALAQHAEAEGIVEKDAALSAGLVLACLLGVHR